MGEELKTAGIVCDDYKVNRYKDALTKAGFTDFEVTPWKKKITVINVKTPKERIHDIHMLCERLEAEFKRRN